MKTLIVFVRATLMWSAFFAATFFVVAYAAKAAPVEVLDPVNLCDRFDEGSDKTKCTEVLKKKKPDSYVSNACALMEEDKAFYACVDIASQTAIDPLQLTPCGLDDLSDAERLSCLQSLKKSSKTAFQSLKPGSADSERKPASKSKSKAPSKSQNH